MLTHARRKQEALVSLVAGNDSNIGTCVHNFSFVKMMAARIYYGTDSQVLRLLPCKTHTSTVRVHTLYFEKTIQLQIFMQATILPLLI